jgi:ABC-type multidrug transport system fused ATPase/permease subunit
VRRSPYPFGYSRLKRLVQQEVAIDPNWQFARDVIKLVWEYRGYSLAILLVTVLQEVSALWPVNLLGQFIDRLPSGDLGNVVWLFLGASILAPGIMRGNIMLRHKMFYETDFQKRVEMTLEVCVKEGCADAEAAGKANSLIANAVSGITNTVYYVLGSFTPVIIKIVVVAGSLLAYNKLLGLAYLGSLIIPTWLTIFFNNWLRVLRDAQYSVISQVEGIVIRTITAQGRPEAQTQFRDTMRERKNILISLVNKHQFSLFVRQAALVGSQFLVVFLALFLQDKLHMTPGDYAKIIGYTTQVAATFLEAAACLDAIISYSRAYHVFAKAHGKGLLKQ